MPSWTDHLRFAFQPIVNLTTGAVVALEILARPEHGDVLAQAHRSPELDIELAALGVRHAAQQQTGLPLHINVYAATVAELPGLSALRRAVRDSGWRPVEITLDLGGPYTHVPPQALLEAVAELRADGFRICADGVGDGDIPLRLLADLAPDIIKLDASLCADPGRSPHADADADAGASAGAGADVGPAPRRSPASRSGRGGRLAVIHALRQLCAEFGGLLAVEGVETERQYAAVRQAGAQLAQGHLFAPPARRPAAEVFVPPAPRSEETVGAVTGSPAGPPVAQFLQPASLLPVTASAGQVRDRLTSVPEVSGVLLVDEEGVPVRAIDRDRFLLSLSGPYGHALYADRPALRLGDRPRTVAAEATAWQVLDVITEGDRDRTGDDVAVVDDHGRCVGVVRLADILRALADSRVEEAARLNPVTRLPGSDAVNDEVCRRLADGRPFALSWLDVDGFKEVNDGAGFAAGDELIRSIGAALAAYANGRPNCRLGHIGGDDFLLLTEPEALEPIAAAMLDAPWTAGGRPVTLSLATVVCRAGEVADHRQAAAALAPLKKAAKQLVGASWVLGRPHARPYEVRRGPADSEAADSEAAAPEAAAHSPGDLGPGDLGQGERMQPPPSGTSATPHPSDTLRPPAAATTRDAHDASTTSAAPH